MGMVVVLWLCRLQKDPPRSGKWSTTAWTVPVKPRGDRSSLPGVNKQVSDIVLLVLKVLSIECALPPQDPKLVS
jgi:hypothetical protein